jgi:hypothetical protein
MQARGTSCLLTADRSAANGFGALVLIANELRNGVLAAGGPNQPTHGHFEDLIIIV